MPPSNTRGVGFDVLGKMRRRVRSVGTNLFRQALGQDLSAEALKLIADGFRGQRDPYGKGWEPLKHRRGKILRDTGRLAASFTATPTGDGLRIRSNVSYAAFHQYGATIKPHKREARILFVNTKRNRFISPTRARRKGGALRKNIAAHLIEGYTQGEYKLAQRQMVPMEQTGGVGPIWGPRLRRVAARFMRDWVRGAR